MLSVMKHDLSLAFIASRENDGAEAITLLGH